MAEGSYITDVMRERVGQRVLEYESYPICDSDIRRWALAVYFPEPPPEEFIESPSTSDDGSTPLVAPEEFNPFAWITRGASSRATRFRANGLIGEIESELGIYGPKFRAILIADMSTEYSGVRMRSGDVIRSYRWIDSYRERVGRKGLQLYSTVARELYNQHDLSLMVCRMTYVRFM